MKILNTYLIGFIFLFSINIISDERASYGNCYLALGKIQGKLQDKINNFVDNTGINPTRMEVFEREDKKLFFTLGIINEDLYKSIKREGLTTENMKCSSGKGYLTRYNLDESYNLIATNPKKYVIKNKNDYLNAINNKGTPNISDNKTVARNNPFGNAFKELEKGLEELAGELDSSSPNTNGAVSNKNLPDSWKKENSNMATYKACQKNGGTPINNTRGYYIGFFDPCLPADYVKSPTTPQECINSKGEIKTAQSGSDPNRMCNQAYKIAQEKKAQKEQKENQAFAAALENRIKEYRNINEPKVLERLNNIEQLAIKNKNIKLVSTQDEWGDELYKVVDKSQKGVEITYRVLINNNTNQCYMDVNDTLLSDSYDVYPWNEASPGNPAWGIKGTSKKDAAKKYVPEIKKIGNPNAITFYRNTSKMFIDDNDDNFVWTYPSTDYGGVIIDLKFDRPLLFSTLKKNYGTEFKCFGTKYTLRTSTRNKETKEECFGEGAGGKIFKDLTIYSTPSNNTIMGWAFEDFYSNNMKDGTQRLLFKMNDGSSTMVAVNLFHPSVKNMFTNMCN